MRFRPDPVPFLVRDEVGRWRDRWEAKWIADVPVREDRPRAVAYRLRFDLDTASSAKIHVSADERYELFVDGQRIGRGPERGDAGHWHYESYELTLSAGSHVIVARTWWLGDLAPYAQLSVRHAFLLAAEGDLHERLSTGVAPWECVEMNGYEWLDWEVAWGCGAKVAVHGEAYPWGFELGEGEGWRPAVVDGSALGDMARSGASVAFGPHENDIPPTWTLRPAPLPPMREETTSVGVVRAVDSPDGDPRRVPVPEPSPACEPWTELLKSGRRLTIPPRTTARAIIDLETYRCGYPELVTSGGKGSRVRIHWAESLYGRAPGQKEWIGHMPKGDRNEVAGRIFWGVGDTFYPDGGDDRRFDTLWWEAGRYVEVLVETQDEPLHLDRLAWRETGYPFQIESQFASSDPRLAHVERLGLNTLRAGTHETYTDSPYYEQIQYVGDTRLEALVTMATCRDASIVRKAVEMLDYSRTPAGKTQSRYPSRIAQFTWGFSLIWVGMVHDWLMWRGEPEFVAARMPGVRNALDAALADLSPLGVPIVPRRNNYNFVDWVPTWWGGAPVDQNGLAGVYAWLLVYALGLAADLEEWVGEPEMAVRWRARAEDIAQAADRLFWSESRGLYLEQPDGDRATEHSQCLALLGGRLPEERRSRVEAALLGDPDLDRTTIYFRHYWFETMRQLGRADLAGPGMATWHELLDLGMTTLPEQPEPTRSDCHAWGAHPVFHQYATVLGIRPTAPGMAAIEIRPQLGGLDWARGSIVHPSGGLITVDVRRDGNRLTGNVKVPLGVRAELFLDREHRMNFDSQASF